MEETTTTNHPSDNVGKPVQIEGVYNIRGFGGYASRLGPNSHTRDVIYRSGHLRDITSRGIEQMRGLGISMIINLASAGEAKVLFSDEPGGPGLGGCIVHNLPLLKHGFSVQQLSEKYSRYLAEGEIAIAQGYFKLLAEGPEVIRDVVHLIRDNPDGVFLIHCSMGKDRTAIIFALLLSLVGVPNDTIATEYSLSEASLEEVLPEIAKAIKKAITPPLTDEEAMARAKIVIKTDKKSMLLTLQMIEEKFGGVKEYFHECCGVQLEDLARIQDILLR